jgi:hypothetical protein
MTCEKQTPTKVSFRLNGEIGLVLDFFNIL